MKNQNLEDPIIKELREIRHDLEKKCNNDFDELYKFLDEAQKTRSSELTTRQAKPYLHFQSCRNFVRSSFGMISSNAFFIWYFK